MKPLLPASSALVAGVLIAAAAANAGTPRHGQPIAVFLTQPPGMPAGVGFVQLGPPTISDTGDVSFAANIVGPGITQGNDSGVWVYSNGLLQPTCREGNPAYQPSNGQALQSFERHRVFNNGRLGAIVRIGISSAPLTNPRKFASGSGAGALVREPQFTQYTLPVQTTARFEQIICDEGTAFANMYVEPVGFAAFDALVRMPPTGPSQIVLGPNTPAWPNMTPGTVASWVPLQEVAGAPDISLRLVTYSASVYYRSIWTNVPTNPTRLLATDDAVQGLPAGVVVNNLDNNIYAATRTGLCAALVDLGGPGISGPLNNAHAIVRAGVNSPTQLIARSGDHAVGTPPDVQYREFTSVFIGDSGHVLFTAVLRGPGIPDSSTNSDQRGVWFFDGQNVHLVWLPNTPVPGLSPSIAINILEPRGIDASGRAVMLAKWWTVGTAQIAKRALLTWDTTRGMSVLAAVGETITLSPTQNYTIDEVDAGIVVDDYTNPVRSLAADGRLAYWVRANSAYTAVMLTSLGSICGRADIAGLGGTSNPDGVLTVDDLIVYLGLFIAGDTPRADFATLGGEPNPDGLLTADDLVAFLAAFFAGCQ